MTLYASQAGPRSSSDLFTIDPLTGVATSIATMTVALTGMALDPTTGIMYGATSGSSNSPRRLVTVDLVTGATTVIGQFLENGSGTGVADIAFDRYGQLWGWSSFSGKLLQIDKATGAFITRGDHFIGSQGCGLDFDWQDNLFGSFNADDSELHQVQTRTLTTPVFPGVEPGAGAGPDDLDDTYGQTALVPTRESGHVRVVATMHGDGYPIAAGAMQDDKFYIIVNHFGSPTYLATVDYYGFITTIGQTTDGIDALATDDPGGRSNWYGVSPYPFIESWEDGPVNTSKWTVYRLSGTSPLDPNRKKSLTSVLPDLDDLDETLDAIQEGESWFSITGSQSALGTHSIFLDYKPPTATNSDRQQLVHWDELGGGTNDVEYWLAYLFMIPDWTVLWNSYSGQAELPDLRNTTSTSFATFSAMGNYLFNSDVTHGYFTDWDGNDHDISAGVWHELRLGFMRRSSDGKAVVTQYLDGALIVDHSVSFGSASPIRGIQWNSQVFYKRSWFGSGGQIESPVYVDPIVWNVGSDPGPILSFVNPGFISAAGSTYQPSLAPSGSAPLNVPFISPATVVYPVSYTGDQDIPAPFIDSTTSVIAPHVTDVLRARITQVPVEVVVQGDSMGRITQVPVEVIVKGDSKGRITQVPVEVVVQNTRITVNTDFIYWVVGDPDA